MQVGLSGPSSSIPLLAVALVATGASVGAISHLKLVGVIKDNGCGASTPVRLVVDGWLEEAGSGSGGGVVLWLMVGSSVEHGTGAISAASDLHGDVLLGDELGIESTQLLGDDCSLTQWLRIRYQPCR